MKYLSYHWSCSKFGAKICLTRSSGFSNKDFGTRNYLNYSCKDYRENFIDPFKEESLIVCCRMWKAEITYTIEYIIRTQVKSHKKCLKWILKDGAFSKKEEYLLKYSDRDYSGYKLFLYFWTFGGMDIRLVQVLPFRSQHAKCKISVLDTEGKILVSTCGEYNFDSGRSRMSPYVLKSKLEYKSEPLHLPSSKLCLLVEMQMSGAGVDGIEQINFREGLDELFACEEIIKDPTAQSVTLTANSLMSNLLNCYNDGKLCDVVLKTENSSFPVHKVILCAQSSVFTAMLETDLKEKQTGTIPIPNISEDTIKKMIMFMYTDQVEDVNFEGAVNLYFASNQYEIVQLKQLCRDFLKSNLDTSNITDALVVADLHQDEELKTASHDFIFEHDSEVIASDKWNQFMQDHLKLAAETTHLMYCRKLKK